MELSFISRPFPISKSAWAMGLAAVLVASPASAVFLDFEDLQAFYLEAPDGSVIYTDNPDAYDDQYDSDDFEPVPVVRQYQDLGVVFGGRYTPAVANPVADSVMEGAAVSTGSDTAVSGQKSLGSFYDPNGLGFQFVGDKLPSYVSFYLSAVSDVATVELYAPGETEGPDGATGNYEVIQTIPFGYEVDSDGRFLGYTGEELNRQKIELFGDEILGVAISNFFGSRSTPVFIDDLTFTYAEVPEPGTLALMVGGLIAGAGVSLRRRRK